MPIATQFVFFNPDLTRIGVRSVVSASYSRRTNRVGTCTVVMDSKTTDFDTFSQEDLGLIIQVGKQGESQMKPDLDAFWLLTDFDYTGSDSEQYAITFVDGLDILRRHRIAYFADEPLGSNPQSRVSEPGNVALKRIFDENMGSLAQDRNLSPYITSEPVTFPSAIINKTLQWKNCHSAMTEITRASREKGTPLFFDMVARESNQFGVELLFKTYINARGYDHTQNNLQDVRIRTTDPNFNLTRFKIDYDVPNYAYVAGAGRGSNRPLIQLSNSRATAGIFARRETYKSIQSTDTNILTDEGYELINSQGVYSLQGTLVGELSQVYSYGDRVNIEHEGLLIPCEISYIKVNITGEVYEKNMSIESS